MLILALALSWADDAKLRHDIAVKFLKAAGHVNLSTTSKIHTVETAPPGSKYQYTNIEGAEAYLMISHFTNTVTHYSDGRIDVYNHSGNPKVKSAQQAIRVAFDWCKRTGAKMPSRFYGPNPAQPVARVGRERGGVTTEYSVEFRDEVRGYPAPGGNHAVLGVSAFAGRVTNYSGMAGITYNFPKTLIGKAKAIEIAKAEYSRSVPSMGLNTTKTKPPQFQVNRFGYHTSSVREADPIFKNLFFDRKARLSYNVEGTFPGKGWPSVCSILVDAETGKLMSGVEFAK